MEDIFSYLEDMGSFRLEICNLMLLLIFRLLVSMVLRWVFKSTQMSDS